MAKKGNIFKIGALALAALIILVLGLLSLGILKYFQPVLYFVTTTESSIQGLKVGSNVKIKGVTIGSVNSIKISTDASTIYITMKFDLDVFLSKSLGNITLAENEKQKHFNEIVTPLVKKGLRCQLQYEGITGDMYVNLAYFDPKQNPELPIAPFYKEYLYIPMVPAASLGNILENIQLIGDKLAEVNFKKISSDADSLIIAIRELTLQVKDITNNSKVYDLANNVGYSLDKFNQTMTSLNILIKTIQMQPDSVVWGKAGQKVVPSLKE